MRLSFADAGLATLDLLLGEFDALCLFIFEDERPLRGAAGYVDWRLCGALSRVLQDGRFTGQHGDALLFPTLGRLAPPRIFCFGAGPRSAFTAASFATVVRKAGEAMSLAGSKAFATEVPALGSDDVERAREFLTHGATPFKGQRILLLGQGKALAKAFAAAGGSMKGLELDKDPLSTGSASPLPPPTRPTGPKTARSA